MLDQHSDASAPAQTPTLDELRSEALRLALCGLRPVALVGRRPARKGWQARLSLYPGMIRETFERAWNADGLAVACGDGHFVVDIDRGHSNNADGVASFVALIKQHGVDIAPFSTVRALTPHGGLHLHLRTPPGLIVRNRVGRWPGVDIKGRHGLATVPPTPGYRWALGCAPWEHAIADAPRWLTAEICPPEPPRAPLGPVRAFSGDIGPYARSALWRECASVGGCVKGGRNFTLFKAAAKLGGLVAGGALPEQIVTHDLLRAAAACGLTSEDGVEAVSKTIASGLKRGRTTPREIPKLRIVHGGRR